MSTMSWVTSAVLVHGALDYYNEWRHQIAAFSAPACQAAGPTTRTAG